MPKLSIIVAVYNTENFLPQCIESILASEEKDFELLLIDNCSTDQSMPICRRYAEKDPRIRVLQEPIKGASAARNCGIAAAQGTYLGFVDSDDYIEPKLYSTLLSLYDNNDVCMAACGVFVDQNGKTPVAQNPGNELRVLNCRQAAELALGHNGYKGFLVNKLFLRKTVESVHLRVDLNLGYCEDLVFVMQYLAASKGEVHYLPIPLYHYRIHENNITQAGFSETMLTGLTSFAKIEELTEAHWPELVPEARACSAGMALTLLNALAESGRSEYEKLPELIRIIREKGPDYRKSNDTAQKAKLRCKFCEIAPKLYFKLRHFTNGRK